MCPTPRSPPPKEVLRRRSLLESGELALGCLSLSPALPLHGLLVDVLAIHGSMDGSTRSTPAAMDGALRCPRTEESASVERGIARIGGTMFSRSAKTKRGICRLDSRVHDAPRRGCGVG